MPIDIPLDHELFIDKHRIIYCVIGYSHPRHRIMAYPKYMPSNNSNNLWIKGVIPYRRITKYYTPKEINLWTILLTKRSIQYAEYDYYYDAVLVKVPKMDIVEYYEPYKRMEEILYHGPNDELEYKLLNLVDLLVEEAGLPRLSFGVSGSILLRMHHKKSDMDIVVYGLDNAWIIKEALLNLLGDGRINPLPRGETEKALNILLENYGIPYNYAIKVLKRRWRRGVYGGTLFSITPTLSISEALKHNIYGKRIHRNLTSITVQAKIVNDKWSMVYPSVYEVKVLSATPNMPPSIMNNIRYIISYNAIFLGLYCVGEIVEASGTLQQVIDIEKEEIYYQVIVGGRENPGFIVCLQ